ACRNGSPGGGLPGDKTPTRGILPVCCALAASGHATPAPPSSVMNSRRLTPNMELPPPQSGCRIVSLRQTGRPVLARDLNRYESRRGLKPPVLLPMVAQQGPRGDCCTAGF